MKEVRVRFAPSPTGPLHIGGVRTALYNYLFAKKNGGKMILRIEDTDQTRFVPGAEDYIVKSLDWCGIKFDESDIVGGEYGPYRQSDRKPLYKQYSDELIEKGFAYYAFDTAEELDRYRAEAEAEKKTFIYNAESRKTLRNSLTISAEEVEKMINDGIPYTVRFKMPENYEVRMHDIIRGDIKVNTNTLDDKVLFKSDGMPTYHLANIVDDHLMKISHVIRGEEWLPSMPLHVLLYQAFGWEAPEFAHLPLLLKPDGNGKLSKRDGDRLGFPVFPLEWHDPKTGDISSGYRESGYLPEAVINFLALLGWNPGNDQEIMSMNELIALFKLERCSKAGAKFDFEKGRWFNHQYLQMTDNRTIAELFMKDIEAAGVETTIEKAEQVVSYMKSRVNFVKELWPLCSFFWIAPTSYDEKAVAKRWKAETPTMMAELRELMAAWDNYDNAETTEEYVKQWCEAKGYGLGNVMNPFRLMLVGELKGPHMFEVTAVLGKEETLRRMDVALNTIK